MRQRVLEREVASAWAKAHLLKHPKDYWLRIPDTGSGTKPFDGILYCFVAKKAVAIEFKVWRAGTPFDWRCVTAHQLRELLKWKKAGGTAWVLVFHVLTGKWSVYEPTREKLMLVLSCRLGVRSAVVK